ncbi:MULTISPECIES: alpha/beta fold hydrolase [Enterococcus]|jgi:pimeloyl-ACP methyl ester carboxylesterase|uniref:AB hydrolase-1 domain-containing protein n=1 Tax=Enterococcus dispar ATCC 51266 TaxID=1139219 RepID=S1N6T4_9ENTE|nr:alpha/beta hydrolase [Enterococcus dispar]EOT42812.1 hypothetical protein OMK_01173 [Enterococcus dispar ATCC 51266]EOW84737.1 hypothetical protein I569_00026 [Enterococcus dispar ATCC 51266]MCU7356316.1 alpha/beta hydrolase [Enterococcus dispar]OJG38146.1 hypothetical protein RV01_GL000506 [Enterococcus dispar]WCG33606.1 alpha/beta hydrolase [Enterococcus dispar]
MTTGFITLSDQTKLYYERYGAGKPLIFLHGNNSSGRYFQKQVPFFAQYFDCLIVDTRGHGRSNNYAKELNFRLLAGDLAEVMEQLNLSKASILGFSDGANLAMVFAHIFPEKVDRLILNSGNYRLNGEKWATKIVTQLGYFVFAFLGLFSPAFYRQKNMLGLMIDDLPISTTDLSHITAKTLVIAGTHDLIKTRHTKKIAALLPNSKLVFIDNAGHTAASSHSKFFNHVVYKFLQEK